MEAAHYHLMDLAFLVVVVVNRLQLAYIQKVPQSEFHSRDEMEYMLDHPEALPSFLSVSFADSSPKARQWGAICALSELLKKTDDHSPFQKLLQEIQGATPNL